VKLYDARARILCSILFSCQCLFCTPRILENLSGLAKIFCKEQNCKLRCVGCAKFLGNRPKFFTGFPVCTIDANNTRRRGSLHCILYMVNSLTPIEIYMCNCSIRIRHYYLCLHGLLCIDTQHK
jgi:hypothetical protein